ncbi:photosystem II biogenesis protein Psp29 [Myxosarcina sp. GI1]|uniref:photosystem II biogenesis protein Psp29 n=1 Tax=Myxosarcina sp. GI1 TaxID=1541065 RepID=UPI00055BEDD7|nr:photosystem II biogenesis protein Psp29 [Myxosarcina sp. GI1]
MKTVSDSKRAFYNHHTRPINSVYRRVIEELLVEMHLLSVNADFNSDPIYYLGVVTSFERLMQGYQPEKDKQSIFNALCKSTDGDPEVYKEQAGSLLSLAQGKTLEELIEWLGNPQSQEGGENIVEPIQAIAKNQNFKYSRPFGIGLYTLLEEADLELIKDDKKRNETLDTLAEKLNLPAEKLKKDLELYRSNLEKMEQLLKVIEDVLQAGRKQRERREQEKQTKETATE